MINRETVLLDLVEKYPQTEDYFREIDKENCVLCYNLFENLELISKKYKMDVDKMIKDLENIIK